MVSRWIRLAAVPVLLTALAGCGGSSAELSAAPAPTTTTVAADPYAIPAVIDEAYVERVLAALEEIRAEVRREVVQTQSFSELSKARLRDIYDEPALDFQLKVFTQASMSPPENVSKNPGVNIHEVTTLFSVRPDCIAADMTVDSSAVSVDGSTIDRTVSVVLKSASTPSNWNPTPFRMITYGGTPIAERGDPCA